MLVTPASSGFWAGRRVLVTGHTGFKGTWLVLCLRRLGARVSGLALEPEHEALFRTANAGEGVDSCIVDIRDTIALQREIARIQPELVFHLAARALVRESYDEPSATFAVNTQGTVNVLEALRHTDATRVIVAVTTDKVYRNRERGHAFREDDELGGHDPYSASKAAAELAIASYRDAFFAPRGVALASARAGNVIGGGDWAADRLLPDAARAWRDDACLTVRRPSAVRPWQHVLEPLHGYLVLAQHLWQRTESAQAFNFGPTVGDARPVSVVIEMAQAAYGRGRWRGEPTPTGPHEAGLLSLDTTRAREILGLSPRWPLATAVQRTMTWYQRFAAGADARSLCLDDIAAYEGSAVP
jgi:CDP-glucose 4,6-dehydratase